MYFCSCFLCCYTAVVAAAAAACCCCSSSCGGWQKLLLWFVESDFSVFFLFIIQTRFTFELQKERGQTPATDGRRLAEVSPTEVSARRTTPPARVSVETKISAVAPGGLQQSSSHSPMPTRARNVLPLPNTTGVRRDRAAAGDRPSPRPTSRPSSPTVVGLAMVPLSVGRGWQMTTPAWVQARVVGGLQLQASNGAQQERDQAPTTAGKRLAEILPPVDRTRRTTSPVEG